VVRDARNFGWLWRLMVRHPQHGWRKAARTGCWKSPDVVTMRCTGASVRRKWTFESLLDAPGTNVRSWAALPQSRRWAGRSRKRRVHGRACIGGARIGAVRWTMSMTIIGAPQCRQMKAARGATTGCPDGGAASGVTCSRPRTFARLARRTGLASSP
jgi:hypothetical protein